MRLAQLDKYGGGIVSHKLVSYANRAELRCACSRVTHHLALRLDVMGRLYSTSNLLLNSMTSP